MRVLHINQCPLTHIGDVSGLSNLEDISFSHWENLTTIDDSMGLLYKLKILCVRECNKLKSFPPLLLPSLEKLSFDSCDKLESVPVMNGSLGQLKILKVNSCSKLKSFLPSSKLPLLETFDLSNCSSLESIPPMYEFLGNAKMLRVAHCHELNCNRPFWIPSRGVNKVPEFYESDKGEVSQMQSSNVEFIRLYSCTLSDKSLSMSLKWFTNVKELDLSGSNFLTIPESIEKCHFLWKLTLDDCKVLQRFKGIPPSLKYLSAYNCECLSTSSIKKLLNQVSTSFLF